MNERDVKLGPKLSNPTNPSIADLIEHYFSTKRVMEHRQREALDADADFRAASARLSERFKSGEWMKAGYSRVVYDNKVFVYEHQWGTFQVHDVTNLSRSEG